jgi:hypothetical protein
VLGCIQNVIKQAVAITWVDNSGKEQTDVFTTAQMLDADPDVPGATHLPFVRTSNGPGLPPTALGLLYGLRGSPVGVPAVTPPGRGPAWDIATASTGPFHLIATDAPSIFVFAFKGGSAVSGSANPIIEVKRSLTLQIWLTAVPSSKIRDVTKHNILAYTDEFTLEGKYDRRATPSSLGFFHFDGSNFTRTRIGATPNIGNQMPPSRRPQVSGPLSVDPVKNWLKTNGFA